MNDTSKKQSNQVLFLDTKQGKEQNAVWIGFRCLHCVDSLLVFLRVVFTCLSKSRSPGNTRARRVSVYRCGAEIRKLVVLLAAFVVHVLSIVALSRSDGASRCLPLLLSSFHHIHAHECLQKNGVGGLGGGGSASICGTAPFSKRAPYLSLSQLISPRSYTYCAVASQEGTRATTITPSKVGWICAFITSFAAARRLPASHSLSSLSLTHHYNQNRLSLLRSARASPPYTHPRSAAGGGQRATTGQVGRGPTCGNGAHKNLTRELGARSNLPPHSAL